uniref:(northern house mosquito) hypothetical protein n=1 Tax=Culex pipiens TaxID=7175 RepID=A0A8D8AC94_CULPI
MYTGFLPTTTGCCCCCTIGGATFDGPAVVVGKARATGQSRCSWSRFRNRTTSAFNRAFSSSRAAFRWAIMSWFCLRRVRYRFAAAFHRSCFSVFSLSSSWELLGLRSGNFVILVVSVDCLATFLGVDLEASTGVEPFLARYFFNLTFTGSGSGSLEAPDIDGVASG